MARKRLMLLACLVASTFVTTYALRQEEVGFLFFPIALIPFISFLKLDDCYDYCRHKERRCGWLLITGGAFIMFFVQNFYAPTFFSYMPLGIGGGVLFFFGLMFLVLSFKPARA